MKIERRKPLTANIAVFGVGHHVYWNQFEGLLNTLNEKLETFARKVGSNGVTVKNLTSNRVIEAVASGPGAAVVGPEAALLRAARAPQLAQR